MRNGGEGMEAEYQQAREQLEEIISRREYKG